MCAKLPLLLLRQRNCLKLIKSIIKKAEQPDVFSLGCSAFTYLVRELSLQFHFIMFDTCFFKLWPYFFKTKFLV